MAIKIHQSKINKINQNGLNLLMSLILLGLSKLSINLKSYFCHQLTRAFCIVMINIGHHSAID